MRLPFNSLRTGNFTGNIYFSDIHAFKETREYMVLTAILTNQLLNDQGINRELDLAYQGTKALHNRASNV